MNKNLMLLRQEHNINCVDISTVVDLSPETVRTFISKHGIHHPRAEAWIKSAIKSLPTVEVIQEKLHCDGNCQNNQAPQMQQLDMFREIAERAVRLSLDIQRLKYTYTQARAKVITDLRIHLENSGVKPSEARLQLEADAAEILSTMMTRIFDVRQEAEKTVVDYLISGYSVNGQWPPLITSMRGS